MTTITASVILLYQLIIPQLCSQNRFDYDGGTVCWQLTEIGDKVEVQAIDFSPERTEYMTTKWIDGHMITTLKVDNQEPTQWVDDQWQK